MDFIKALMGTSPPSQDTIYKAINENPRLLILYYYYCMCIEGERILCLSIKRQSWKDFKNRLFRIVRDVEKITPLRLVISSNVIDIALELVNINAYVNRQENQLQNESALQDEFFEAVCMLLYYGADVYITTSHNITPFRYAVHEKCENLAKLLIDYYDETYYSEGPVENDFNTRICLNYECEGAALLLDSVDNPNPEIFKLIWDRIHPLELLTSEELNFLLLTYLSSSKFPKPDWLECLRLILEHFSNRHFNCEYKEVLKRVHKIKYSYQFHDTVKKLNFPKVVQDVILFKSALY